MSNELLESILIQRYEQLKHEYWWSFETEMKFKKIIQQKEKSET